MASTHGPIQRAGRSRSTGAQGEFYEEYRRNHSRRLRQLGGHAAMEHTRRYTGWRSWIPCSSSRRPDPAGADARDARQIGTRAWSSAPASTSPTATSGAGPDRAGILRAWSPVRAQAAGDAGGVRADSAPIIAIQLSARASGAGGAADPALGGGGAGRRRRPGRGAPEHPLRELRRNARPHVGIEGRGLTSSRSTTSSRKVLPPR